MTVSDFSRSRPAAESPKRSRLPTVRRLITGPRWWLAMLAFVVSSLVLIIVVVGSAGGVAWQSYGGGVREAVAGWSPRLAWVAPAAAPSASAERVKATSVALAAVRQSV